MSRAEREKWDERYRSGAYEDRTHPTALLAEWIARLPRGRALDVACGAGRNALYLAANDYAVDALDISAVGLERARQDAGHRGLAVNWLCGDLEETPDDVLPHGPYDLIVWVRYVNHALLPHLAARLRSGGHLVCEQHLATPGRRGRPEERRVSAAARAAVALRGDPRRRALSRRARRRSGRPHGRARATHREND